MSECSKLLMFPQYLQSHTELFELPDHCMTKKGATECMRRKWLRLKFIKDSMNGTGFPLTALFTWQGSFTEKKKTQPTKNPTLLPPLPFSFWNSSVEKLQYGFSIRIPASYLQAFYLYKTPSIILPETLRRIANFSVNYKQFPLFFFLKTACFLEIFIYKCTTQHSMMQSMERS